MAERRQREDVNKEEEKIKMMKEQAYKLKVCRGHWNFQYLKCQQKNRAQRRRRRKVR